MNQLSELENQGVFSTLDVELAQALCRLSGEHDDALALAVALASREVQAGHVCADLKRLAAQPLGDETQTAVRCPALGPWVEQLARSSLVSTQGLLDPARPLVLDGQQRLYLARHYEHEQRLAEQLLALVLPAPVMSAAETPRLDRAPEVALPPVLDQALLERLFPHQPGKLDLQREAALSARTRRLSIIVGGPGTGKTATVVKLLALLVADALSEGRPPPRTLLVAPTGKAAQRLSESIDRARERLPVEPNIKRAIASSASTLHRALGPLDGSLTRFRHGVGQPLECDLVLLDEASMVDLALMRRFFDALPPHARVILLGDPDQLASVEAGSVLYDLCRAAELPGSPLSGSVSRLTQSYRYPEDSGIAALARAVHGQDLDEALRVLRAGLLDVALQPPLKARELGRALEREAKTHYQGLREDDLETRLLTLDRFRVLCAHRGGPASVEQLNPLLARALGQQRGISYAGRPIIITQNDYATQLFNGDVGVLHGVRGRTQKRELVACFRTAETAARQVSLARLPSHESAYAMTVHKSQGSEFERVAIVLPERPSRILSRELFFTAITRAKLGVSVYAGEASLRACIEQRVERSSGLVDRLIFAPER